MRILTDKKIKEALGRIAANYVIANDALMKSNMTVEEFSDAVNHVADNAISASQLLYGCDGIMYVNDIIHQYYNQNKHGISREK
jgi:hypothetical protein